MRPNASPISPVCLSVADTCARLGVGRSTIYELIASGELRTLKIGRRTLITVESQDALVARRLAKEAA